VQATEIAGELVVGREAPATLAVEDTKLSRRHFRILNDGTACSIEDLRSRNGTYVNGRRVERQELCDGDVIEAGGQMFVLLGNG
jgi:pSer/pThr/pTyr-binding forkhead associated (FHA) protein